MVDGRAAEHREGRLLELDRDLARLRLQRLAGAQIERHARPAPVVDVQLERDVGLGVAVGRNIGCAAVIPDRLVRNVSGPILRPHRIVQRVRHAFLLHRLEELGFLRPHGAGLEACRRFHGDDREELEEVIGHHVAQRPGGVVETAAPADPLR